MVEGWTPPSPSTSRQKRLFRSGVCHYNPRPLGAWPRDGGEYMASPLGNELTALLVSGKTCFQSQRVGQSSFGPQALPLPLSVHSHAGAGNASHKVFPKTVKSGVRSPPHLTWEMQRRARGVLDHQVFPIGGAQQKWGSQLVFRIPGPLLRLCFILSPMKTHKSGVPNPLPIHRE